MRTLPAIFGDQVTDCFGNCRRRIEARLRPDKSTGNILTQSDKNNTRAKLGHSKVAGIDQPPFRSIAKGFQIAEDRGAVAIKDGIKQTAHIFQHHRTWLRLGYDANGFRKKIALVGLPKLLACDRKRRTGNTAGKQVNPLEALS